MKCFVLNNHMDLSLDQLIKPKLVYSNGIHQEVKNIKVKKFKMK